MTKGTKIAVVGAGAIGSVLGGFLAKGGAEVHLLGREPHMGAIQEKGLKITGIWGEYTVQNLQVQTSVEELEPPYDIVLIVVKSYQTPEAVKSGVKLLSEESVMVSCQNGLGNLEAVATAVGEERAAAARVIFGAELTKPGEVKVTVYADPVVVGPFLENPADWAAEKLKTLSSLWNDSGIPSNYDREIRPYLWAKILYNCPLNPLASILGIPYGPLADHAGTQLLMNQIVSEIFEVAKAKRIKLFWSSPEEYLQSFYIQLIPSTYDHRPSMAVDLARGKRTEIDAMNGMICRYGAEEGIDTPYNRTVFQLIQIIEGIRPPLSFPSGRRGEGRGIG